MSAVATTDVAQHEAWTREYWLRHCEGYCVETSHGHIGFVEEVIGSSDGGEPRALLVRTGLGGGGLLVVPVGMVRAIHPDGERVVVE